MRLTILHTNDIHSNYENFSKVVSKIDELKDSNTLILDAGDFADFKRIELQGTNGLAAMELLECAGYDALAIGNNELFPGIDVLKNMAANTDIPLLSSNLLSLNNKPIENVRKSIIIDRSEMRILLIAGSPNLGPFTEMFGFSINNYLEVIQNEIKANEDNYDLCILLSHLGMDKDKEIAVKISGIDIIIGGHSHILMEKPEVEKGKIIFTSGSYGEHLGKLVLEVDKRKVVLIEGSNINVNQCKESNKILDIIKRNKEKAIEILGKSLYKVDRDIWHDVVEENPMTNLLADALRDTFECDMGIINSGVMQGGIKKGNISRKKMIELCPSPLNPTCFEIQGKDIWEALQQSLDTDYCYADGKGPGFRGKYVGRLHVSNAVIEHNGRKINNIYVNGEKMIAEKWYAVASSDYLQRGTGYRTLANNKNEKYNKEFLRDTIQKYLEEEEYIEKAFIDRWNLR